MNRIAGWTATLCLGLFLGFGVGRNWSRPIEAPPTAEESVEARKLRELREKLVSFSEHDLEDYVRLKSLEERYKKADELVGKMILILLADVGVRISREQESFAKNPPHYEPPRKPSPSPLSSPTPAPSRAVSWRTFENRLRNGENSAYILRQLRVPDFGDELTRSTVISNVDSTLNGCYEGQVTLGDGSNRVWQVRMDVTLQSSDSSPTGRSLIELSENGKVFSRSDNTGSQQNFRRLPDGSSALVVVVSDSISFQLYYLSYSDEYVGNLYQRTGVTPPAFKGTVVLYRRSSC